ncbi:MAG TPA: acetyl-CoA carboxylase biotin carboxyl carrier protein [Candidatus Omnitrophota bacterium]|nr:acetyl-CoA carboxylase biotin carboxyl carrier protein [Candidatus Omnitrophota bacterium]HRY85142.1 acetyl-CoA carboxylase biotin carboxyl carrier protein [Candidatus Omnitrophota bacterium]
MNIKEIRELLELMAEHNLGEIEVEKDDMKIKLRKLANGRIMVEGAPQMAAPAPAAMPASAPAAAAAPAGQPAVEEGVTIVRSPMVGTFYAAPAPDQPPYVTVGKVIKEGDVLCIIEAMKLMNEIKAELGGTVIEVMVQNGQTVEYDQPIFKIKKS